MNDNMRVVNSIGSADHNIQVVVEKEGSDLDHEWAIGVPKSRSLWVSLGYHGDRHRAPEDVRPENIRTSGSKSAIGTGVHSQMACPSRASGRRVGGSSSVNRSSADFSLR